MDHNLQIMAQRKSWTQQQDRALKFLYQQKGITKWAELSRNLQKDYGIIGRSGKQCRERYHNHLDNSIKRSPWTQQEEQSLINLHSRMGNQWAYISRRLPGRSQNCVKNKLYSVVRKGLKLINHQIKTKYRRFKCIEIAAINQIIEFCQQKYKSKRDQNSIQQIIQLKKSILQAGIKQQNHLCKNQLIETIQQIKQFTRKNKKIQIQSKKKQQVISKNQHSSEQKDVLSSCSLVLKKQSFKIQDYQIVQNHSQNSRSFSAIDNKSYQNIVIEHFQVKNTQQKVLNRDQKLNFHQQISDKNIKKSKEKNLETTGGMQGSQIYDLLPAETIKSFGFPEDDEKRDINPNLQHFSPYFDQIRGTSFYSWNQFSSK